MDKVWSPLCCKDDTNQREAKYYYNIVMTNNSNAIIIKNGYLCEDHYKELIQLRDRKPQGKGPIIKIIKL